MYRSHLCTYNVHYFSHVLPHTKVQEGSYFWGTKDFCPNFPKLARKNFGPSAVHCMRTEFRMSTKKQRLHVILGAIFSNQSTLGAGFACIFKEFAQIFRDFVKVCTDFAQTFLEFARIFRDFSRIFTKSRLLGVRLHPFTPASYTTGIISSLLSALIY